jgi:PAS domain S-box-containing protein
MGNAVKILLLEDNLNDAQLVYWKLQQSGMDFLWTHVSDLLEFDKTIDILKPDLILSDFNMLGFTGLDALEIVKQKFPFTPFIIVTGNLDEETAVETIKAGAWDYIIKDRLTTLNLAIKKALELKKEKEAKNQALENLKKSEERFALAIDGTMDGIWDQNFETGESYYSPNYRLMLGYNEKEFPNRAESWINVVHPDDKESTFMLWQKHLVGEIPQFYAKFRMKCKNECYKWILGRGKAQFDNSGKAIRISGSNKDISEDKIKEIELLKHSRAVQNAPISIMLTDPKGNIEYVNPKFLETSGYSWEEVIGKPASILKSGRHDLDFYKKLWSTILQGKEWFGDFLNKKKDGTLYWESASISEVKDPDGELIGYTAIKEDITIKKNAEFELIKAKEKAEESNRIITTFLNNVSHEIRTPMNGILGFTNLLNKDNLTNESKNNYIQIIISSTNRLLNVINNILDISKIESNQLEFIFENINVGSFIEKLFIEQKESKLKAAKPEIELRISLPEDMNKYTIKTDFFKFKQIWENLISNALKFTDKGYVEIGCNIKYKKQNKEIEFYVKDTGIGITENDKVIIFAPFRQANNERFKEGVGLGLSITKALVELLDGRIWFDSTPGIGSTFYFTLPINSEGNQLTKNIKNNAE